MTIKERIGAAVLLLLCLGFVLLPSVSLLSLLFQISLAVVSGVHYHYFRRYLNSAPSGTTTVNKYVFYSLTWAAQLTIGYLRLLILASSLLKASIIKELIVSHPSSACVFLSPQMLAVCLGLHFSVMTGIKLYISFLPQRFLGLNHERLWRGIQITGLLIILSDFLARLLLNGGTTCFPRVATSIANIFLGIDLPEKTFGEEKNGFFENIIPTPLMLFAIACLNYLIASVFTFWSKRGQRRAIHHAIPKLHNTALIQDQEMRSIGQMPTSSQAVVSRQVNQAISNMSTLEASVQHHLKPYQSQLPSIEEPESESIFVISSNPSENLQQLHLHPGQAPIQQQNSNSKGGVMLHVSSLQVVAANSPGRYRTSQQETNPDHSRSSRLTGNQQDNFPQDPFQNLQIPNPASTISTGKKILQVLSLGGFVSGVSITFCIALLFSIDIRSHWDFLRVISKSCLLILELMPVYWMKCVTEAKELMTRRIKELIQI